MRDETVKRFFSREQVFPMWSPRTLKEGQVIKIIFGNDNRHLRGMVVVEEKAAR